jgi:hypothetical protein
MGDGDQVESVYKFGLLVMPDLIGHRETLENTGFRLEFIPMKIGAGMTTFYENQSLWTDTK